jgi:hypothetical protein
MIGPIHTSRHGPTQELCLLDIVLPLETGLTFVSQQDKHRTIAQHDRCTTGCEASVFVQVAVELGN